MAVARYDPVRALVDLLEDAGALFYTKPCWMKRQLHVYLFLLEVFTKRPSQRLRHAFDTVAAECGCEFVNSNLDAGFVVYSVGPRARELELKIGDVLIDLPEYLPVSSIEIAPVGSAEAQLYAPTRLDLPRDSQMPNPMVYRRALNMLVRLGEYLWEKRASLPANFRREAEGVLLHMVLRFVLKSPHGPGYRREMRAG